MKITDLQLEQYGIYHNASWQPAGNALNVVMGENESGKTTMLRFIRDMLFGYGRGKWQGRHGSMGFVRSDGKAYRVFREEKERWFEDENHARIEEELPKVWWHGLTRSMYEKIFAMGLEDLQGASFLSDDAVRSRFFMLEGGDTLSRVKKTIAEDKEKLLVVSPQGKRKINQLMADLDAVNQELEGLAGQEERFASLQKRQGELREEVEALQKKLSADQELDKSLEKRLGAWQYYERAREIKRQLSLSEQVKMFPANGKEQWNTLMNRMDVIHGQKESLQKKLDAYHPVKKEEVIPWVSVAGDLEKLYVDLGQWRQMILDAEEMETSKENWRLDFVNMGYSLPLWDHPLSLDQPWTHVDWDMGRRLAQSVGVRDNELHFWQQREPVVETVEEEAADGGMTEEEWQSLEAMGSRLESLLHEEADLKSQMGALSGEEDKRFTPWFWISILCLAGAAASLAAFYMAMAGYAALYGAAAGVVLAVGFFLLHNKAVHQKGNDLSHLTEELQGLEQQRAEIAKKFPVALPASLDDLQAFHNLMQEKRASFYKDQAKKQAISWKRETIRKEEAKHDAWLKEGETLKKKKEEADKAWISWLSDNHLPSCRAADLSALQEQWQKIYTEVGRGRILDVRLEQMDEKLDDFSRRAEAIIRAAGLKLPVSPDSIASLYEENHERNLKWQAISEKNRQHEAYEAEMKKLDDAWASCQREMDMLLSLVNAKDAQEFAEKVTAHEHHDQLVKEWEAVKQDLRLYAGSDAEFQKLWASLTTGKYDDWMKQHQELAQTIKQETADLGARQRDQGAVDNEIMNLAKDHSMTGALQKKEEIQAEIREALSDWLTCFYTEELLNHAETAYEQGRQPAIIKQADTFLQAMTKGRYSLTMPEKGKDIAIVDETHHVKGPKLWSSGTGDQVYLAIRLAMALSFGSQLEPLPIVLDDIFVRFDETRQRQTLRFLMDLGRQTQIFLFTCHNQTMRIAQEVGAEKGTGAFVHLVNGEIEVA